MWNLDQADQDIIEEDSYMVSQTDMLNVVIFVNFLHQFANPSENLDEQAMVFI